MAARGVAQGGQDGLSFLRYAPGGGVKGTGEPMPAPPAGRCARIRAESGPVGLRARPRRAVSGPLRAPGWATIPRISGRRSHQGAGVVSSSARSTRRPSPPGRPGWGRGPLLRRHGIGARRVVPSTIGRSGSVSTGTERTSATGHRTRTGGQWTRQGAHQVHRARERDDQAAA